MLAYQACNLHTYIRHISLWKKLTDRKCSCRVQHLRTAATYKADLGVPLAHQELDLYLWSFAVTQVLLLFLLVFQSNKTTSYTFTLIPHILSLFKPPLFSPKHFTAFTFKNPSPHLLLLLYLFSSPISRFLVQHCIETAGMHPPCLFIFSLSSASLV